MKMFFFFPFYAFWWKRFDELCLCLISIWLACDLAFSLKEVVEMETDVFVAGRLPEQITEGFCASDSRSNFCKLAVKNELWRPDSTSRAHWTNLCLSFLIYNMYQHIMWQNGHDDSVTLWKVLRAWHFESAKGGLGLWLHGRVSSNHGATGLIPSISFKERKKVSAKWAKGVEKEEDD